MGMFTVISEDASTISGGPAVKGEGSRYLVPVADGMYPISWAIASLLWSEYHPYLKGMRQGATRRVARRYKTLKRRYTAIEAAAELARSPANGAINGSGRSWWRHVFEGRARARGGV